MAGKSKPNGVILYQGPSRIDGAPIVVIAVGLRTKSTNAKTGAMVQTYILRSDVGPMDALATGADASICGTCPHRPRKIGADAKSGRWGERSCYVNVSQGPNAVWKSYRRGIYADVTAWDAEKVSELFTGKPVRLGTYGDPAAAPLEVWKLITASSAKWTGYTHQWDRPDLRDTLELCQLSADSCHDVTAARAMGVGYFRVLQDGEEPARDEMVCPASEEAGKRKDCASCGACRGATGARVVIRAHGIGAGAFKGGRRAVDLRSLPVINARRAVAVA